MAQDGTTVRTATLYGNPWTFTGRRLDQETGLMYYRNRMYSTELGRFCGRDPIGYRGGINLYGYVGQRPTAFLDPFGLDGKENEKHPNPIKCGTDDCPCEVRVVCHEIGTKFVKSMSNWFKGIPDPWHCCIQWKAIDERDGKCKWWHTQLIPRSYYDDDDKNWREVVGIGGPRLYGGGYYIVVAEGECPGVGGPMRYNEKVKDCKCPTLYAAAKQYGYMAAENTGQTANKGARTNQGWGGPNYEPGSQNSNTFISEMVKACTGKPGDSPGKQAIGWGTTPKFPEAAE